MTSKSMLHSLNEEEYLLVTSTGRAELADLDEDALSDLHDRVRRARSKYVKQYRRGAATRVSTAGGRGKARPQNRRAADKAEVFEEALARVSTALAAAARRSAADLKAERLAAARGEAVSAPGSGPAAESDPAGQARSAAKTPISRKDVASSRAKGARRQAKRDAR